MERTAVALEIEWSEDLFVVPGDASVRAVLAAARKRRVEWIVIVRPGQYLYAFRRQEFIQSLRAAAPHEPLQLALHLREEDQSTRISEPGTARAIDRSWRPHANAPSVARWVKVDGVGRPIAVGAQRSDKDEYFVCLEDAFDALETTVPYDPAPQALPPPAATSPRTRPPGVGRRSRGRSVPIADEGTRPVRYPSIEADRVLTASQPVKIIVDLLRTPDAQTVSDALDVGEQPRDWQTIDLGVALSSAEIDFGEKDLLPIAIVRNGASKRAEFSGIVREDVQPGTAIVVTAAFFERARFCGSALRRFIIGLAKPDRASDADAIDPPLVRVERDAEHPDVTVFIERLNKSTSGLLRWRVVPYTLFDGLPPCLREDIDLGDAPGAIAKSLFEKFPTLVPGQHRRTIEGLGDELWRKAPHMFRQAYWALVARYGRRLTIQFISDEPHLPWELMRPSSDDEQTVHEPLALQHTVARWIDRYVGDMSNTLPSGSLVSIAPKYASARLELPYAQKEHQKIVEMLGATPLAGTRDQMLGLLENGKPMPPVAVLHFAGHGAFSADVAAASSIKLENGMTLTAAEVKRKEVQLGRACRTLVFFNACEVGAAGCVFGEVGGWADAFLERRFGGFIAPLWAVEEEDSAQVASELLDSIYARRAPIGAALREIRAKYATRSPTFFSYLYYGDVTARIAK